MKTVDKIQKLLETNIEDREGFQLKHHAKRVCCVGGLSLSIQASEYHYCSPRVNKPTGGYDCVEVGFPTRKLQKLKQYAEQPMRMTKSVFGYVPIKELAEVIDDFGGIKE